MSTTPIPTKMVLSAGEQLAGLALGAVLLVGGGWWSAVMLCARLSGGRWPHLNATQVGQGLSHAATHPQDPAGGLSPALAGHTPGPLAFYLVVLLLVILTGLAIGLVLAVLRGAIATPGALVTGAVNLARRRRMTGQLTRDIHGGAQWAKRSDLDELVVRRPEPGRVTLGRWNGRLVAGQARHSVIVVGPPGSMKTTALAVPAILEWQGPVLATSVKSDLLHDTLARREQLGEVFVFDPTESTNVAGSTWTPLSRCDTWFGAQRTASWLCQAVHSTGKSGGGDFDFWYAAAAKLLAPLLFAAATSGASMRDVVRWVNTQEADEVIEALEEAGDEGAQNAWKATELRDNRQRSSIYTTTETVLDAYGDPRVLKASDGAQLTAAGLLDGGMHTAYVCAPADEQARLRPLLSTLIYDVVAEAYAKASRTNGPLDPPLLIVLDELANIAPLRDLDTLASTARGQGIQLVSIVQDMAQLISRYGQDRARTIVNNHHAKLILSGVGDTATLDMVGKLVGDTAMAQRSVSAGDRRGHQLTQSTTYRRLAPAELVRGQPPGSGLLIYGHLPAAQLQLRPWFSDRALQTLANAEA